MVNQNELLPVYEQEKINEISSDSEILNHVNLDQDGIQVSDVILAISYAKDFYNIACALNSNIKISDQESFFELSELQKKLIQIFSKQFFNNFHWQAIDTAKKLSKAGIGNALTLISGILNNAKEFETKFLNRISSRKLLEDSLVGRQIFGVFLERNKELFIGVIEEARKNRKYNEEQQRQISDLLLDFISENTFIQFTIPKDEANECLEKAISLMTKMANDFKLQSLFFSYSSFKELLRINGTLRKCQFSESERDHLSILFREYFISYKKECSADINRMIFALDKIRPILNFSISDLSDLLDGSYLANKAVLIINNFKQASSQVYKTYEGLGLAANCYLEATQALGVMIESVKNEKNRSEVKQQLEKYNQNIINYFQLSMRIVMPLKEFTSACQAILMQLNTHNCKETLENPLLEVVDNHNKSGAIRSNEIMLDIKKIIQPLESCCDLLRQKALVINALRDISDFIVQIKNYLEKPEEKYSFSFFGNVVNLKPVLTDVMSFLINISQSSRTEDYANFLGILMGLNRIIQKHKIRSEIFEKQPSQCAKGEKLLLNIYHRYTENVKNFKMNTITDIEEESKNIAIPFKF